MSSVPAKNAASATITPRPVRPEEAWSVRRTTWEADEVPHPEVVSTIVLALEAPGHYADRDGVSVHLYTAGGPHGRRDSDQCRIDCFWWELEALASGLAALIEQARRDGTIPPRAAVSTAVTGIESEATLDVRE